MDDKKRKIDVSYAVFQGKPGAVQRTIQKFKDKFGEEIYKEYLAPFIEREGVRYIFGARTSKYKTAFLRGLTREVARDEKEEPDLPDILSEEQVQGVCYVCWETTDLKYLENNSVLGQLCNVCAARLLHGKLKVD